MKQLRRRPAVIFLWWAAGWLAAARAVCMRPTTYISSPVGRCLLPGARRRSAHHAWAGFRAPWRLICCPPFAAAPDGGGRRARAAAGTTKRDASFFARRRRGRRCYERPLTTCPALAPSPPPAACSTCPALSAPASAPPLSPPSIAPHPAPGPATEARPSTAPPRSVVVAAPQENRAAASHCHHANVNPSGRLRARAESW